MVSAGPDKIERLVRLSQLGLPVPPLQVVAPGQQPDDDAMAPLLAAGPVIVRGAMEGEDTRARSGAGLGESVADVRDMTALRRALRRVRAAAEDPTTRHVLGPTRAWAIVQRQIRWRVLLVAVADTSGVYLEAHEGGPDPLARGASPRWSGPLEAWLDPARAEVMEVVHRTMTILEREHALDLELVIDHDDGVWLVQARPIVAPLVDLDGFARVRATTEGHGWPARPDLRGLLELDGEHNPEPLSPAQAWLVAQLQEGEATRSMEVVGAHLYTRPSDGPGASPPPGAQTLRELLDHLLDVTLPRARGELADLRASAAAASRPELSALLERALAGCRAALHAHARVAIQRPSTSAAALAASLWDREAYLDVLPTRWDVCAQSLSELGTRALPSRHDVRPQDPAQIAALLGEVDDHLFAMGLAHFREWYLAAARVVELPAQAVFHALPYELLDLTTRELRERCRARRRATALAAALSPPARLWHGRPLPARGGLLSGVGIGPCFTGILTHRADLADLVRRPPGLHEVVVLPTLLAQAAVALSTTRAAAVVTEHGGAASHGALMARELGISALVGCRGATALPEGAEITLDTRAGRLRLH